MHLGCDSNRSGENYNKYIFLAIYIWCWPHTLLEIIVIFIAHWFLKISYTDHRVMNHEQFLKNEINTKIVPTLSSKKPWSSVRCWPRSLSVSRSVSSSSATNATAHKFSIFFIALIFNKKEGKMWKWYGFWTWMQFQRFKGHTK